MARTRGGSRIQPRRSSRLQRLREPRQVISETIDIVDSSDLNSIEEENMIPGNLEQNVGRTFQEIEKRIKKKAKRPPQSPEVCNESWFLEDHIGQTDADMGHTGNQANEEDFTVNEANANMGATRNESNEEEVGEKIKKAKFCRKRFQTKDDQEVKRRKHIYKRNTNVDDEEIGVQKKALIRNSPRLFSEMVYYLTEEQKIWVKKAGFESLLQFDLEMLPNKLVSKVVQAFDHTSVSIGIENGRIYITEEDVFCVLGLTNGGKTIEQKTTEITTRRHTEWIDQFPNEQITTARVVEKIRAEAKATEMFKINFLTVLSNVLIGTPTHSYVDKMFTKFEDLDSCVMYNWAKYLIEYLVIAKECWNRTASEFFRGSHIFLTLFYVDRVMHKGIEFVQRKFPSYRGWNEDKLKERQAIEVLSGEFGKGKILCTLKEHFSQESQSQKNPSPDMNVNDDQFYGKQQAANDSNNWTENMNFDTDELHGREQDNWTDDWTYWQQDNLANDYDDCSHYNKKTDVGNGDGCWDKYIQRNDVGKDRGQWGKWPSNKKDDIHIGMQCGTTTHHEHAENVNLEDEELKKDITELSEEDCVELLRDRAAEIINAKMQFEKDLKKAMGKHPLNKQLMIIRDVFSEIFNAKNGDGATKDSSDKGRGDDSDVEKKERQEDVVKSDAEDINEVDNLFLDPNLLDQIEIIEYLHSEEGLKEIDALYSNVDDVPSFSLGPEIEIVSKVCRDINEEYDSAIENDDFVTPKPVLREKSTRLIKLGPYAKSPYINRVIDINGKCTAEDITMWRYMSLTNRNPLEEVFVWKGISCIREHMWTMKCNAKLYYSIIDTWSTILNDREYYKADESPLRLFCTIGGLNWSLDVKKKVAVTYPIFQSNMNDLLSRYPSRKMQDIAMVFFPIYAFEHFYLICYNLKKPGYEIIDNIKHKEDPKQYYGKVPAILHSHFVKYLQGKGLQVLSQIVRNLKPDNLEMAWQTERNSNDCGIFVMRHMETYKGDRTWDCGLKNEGCGQFRQMIKLRAKYNNAIMASHINEKRAEIITEAKNLFKEGAQQTVMKVAATKVGGQQRSRKTVTFSPNLANKFDEA